MSDQPPQVPSSIEKPQESADESLEQLEEKTLNKLAKSAAYRAVFEHNQHLIALNSRIDVLQSKLDARERDLNQALPRVAELEQAKKTARLGAAFEAVGTGAGAILLATASFIDVDWIKYSFFGAGIASAALGVFAKLLFTIFGWPRDTAPTRPS